MTVIAPEPADAVGIISFEQTYGYDHGVYIGGNLTVEGAQYATGIFAIGGKHLDADVQGNITVMSDGFARGMLADGRYTDVYVGVTSTPIRPTRTRLVSRPAAVSPPTR